MVMSHGASGRSKKKGAGSRAEEGPGGVAEERASVPLPIQSFLWLQTTPFLGATVGKATLDSACLVSTGLRALE